jgi:glycopeptide antibiotics resistance protein
LSVSTEFIVTETILKSKRAVLFATLGLACIGPVFFLSWIPDPALVRCSWVPAEIGQWADRHVTLRTGVAMVPLGLVLGIGLVGTQQKLRAWLLGGISLTAVVVVAELGQLLLPRRVFDFKDILWGTAGAITGLGLAKLTSAWVLKVKRARSRVG